MALVLLVALGSVFAATAVFRSVVPVNASTAGFAYLIEVLVTAAYGGFYESVVAAFVAAVCFNYYFLPPIGTWVITDPHNWVALFAFLASSLIASELSANARRRAAEATSRRLEVERLYELSRVIMRMDPSRAIAGQLAEEVRRVFQIRSVAIFDLTHRGVYSAGDVDMPDAELRLKRAARNDAALAEPDGEVLIRPITLGGKSMGSMMLRGSTSSEAAIQALLNLIAITLENARSHQIATSAEAVRQSEEFKSTLLDALAHEFKTPLTSIKGATTALLAGGNLNDRQREELLTVVDQEAERLNRMVTETTHLARIEAGKVQLDRHLHSVSTLVGGALDQMALGRDGRMVDLSIAEGLPPVRVDLVLMQVALRQLLDNAVKYSPPRSPLGISARIARAGVEIGVHNWGEVLSEADQMRVFDKFYRGQNVRHHVLGTGMGLAIAREILAAHGGSVRVESSPERGTEFVLRFPANPEGEGA